MSRFGTYTRFTARPGERDRLVDNLLNAARLMEGATGCEMYIVNTLHDDADTVWVTELWTREESHASSLSIEGAAELIGQTMPLLAGPPEQIRLVPVGGKGLAA